MILLYYRIIADFPVIIIGETDYGKTSLIIKLNQILNNGENNVEIINIHPGVTERILYQIMQHINEKAKRTKKE